MLFDSKIFVCFLEQGAYSACFKHAGKSGDRLPKQAGKQAKVCSQRTRTAAVQPYNSDLHVDNEALQKKGRVACCSPHACDSRPQAILKFQPRNYFHYRVRYKPQLKPDNVHVGVCKHTSVH